MFLSFFLSDVVVVVLKRNQRGSADICVTILGLNIDVHVIIFVFLRFVGFERLNPCFLHQTKYKRSLAKIPGIANKQDANLLLPLQTLVGSIHHT